MERDQEEKLPVGAVCSVQPGGNGSAATGDGLKVDFSLLRSGASIARDKLLHFSKKVGKETN